MTRHVNSVKTNKYWNNSIRCIRRFYPQKKIIIIDDNSNPEFLKAEYEYINLEIIQSEFCGISLAINIAIDSKGSKHWLGFFPNPDVNSNTASVWNAI